MSMTIPGCFRNAMTLGDLLEDRSGERTSEMKGEEV